MQQRRAVGRSQTGLQKRATGQSGHGDILVSKC
jgi:hypothetical protein